MKNRVVISLIILIMWTILVLSGNISFFDNAIYEALISFKSDIFTNIMKVITFFSSVKLMIILGSISLLLLIFKRKESLYLLCSLSVSSIINLVFKNIIKRDRPTILRLIDETGYSYPSGHAMASMSFYGAIIVLVLNSNLEKKYKWLINIIFSILIFLIGISRIYLGVHYPSDIIGGWIIGFILLNILNEIIKRRKNESTNNRCE